MIISIIVLMVLVVSFLIYLGFKRAGDNLADQASLEEQQRQELIRSMTASTTNIGGNKEAAALQDGSSSNVPSRTQAEIDDDQEMKELIRAMSAN